VPCGSDVIAPSDGEIVTSTDDTRILARLPDKEFEPIFRQRRSWR